MTSSGTAGKRGGTLARELLRSRRFYLQSQQREYELGDKLAPIRALLLILQEGMRSPEWLAKYLVAHIEEWLRLEAKTLDEALDVQWPKHKSFSASQRARQLGETVYAEVTRLHEQDGWPIDERLFEQVAANVGKLKKTKIAEIYYYMKDEKDFLSSAWDWRQRNPDARWQWPARLPQNPSKFRK